MSKGVRRQRKRADAGLVICIMHVGLGDQQAKYNFQGTIAFIIMKSLQRTAQTSARAPEDAAGCPSAALQFMLSRGCNYRLHYWISLWKSAIAPQIITPIHGGGLRSAQREWPRGRRIGGTLRRVTRSGTCSATTTKPPPVSGGRRKKLQEHALQRQHTRLVDKRE